MSGTRGFVAPGTVSSGRGGSEGSWWRWTQGRPSSTNASGRSGASDAPAAGASDSTRRAAKASPEVWDALSWSTRTTRGKSDMSKQAAFSAMTTTPLLPSAAQEQAASSRGAFGARRKTVQPSMHLRRAVTAPTTKRGAVVATGLGSTRASATGFGASRDGKVPSQPAVPTKQEDRWRFEWTSGHSSKRKTNRKEKRVARAPSPLPRKTAFVAVDDVVMTEATPAESGSGFGAAPVAPTTAVSSLGFGNPDPLVTCARAVLQDCLRQRCLESSNVRKRTLEGCAKYGTGKESKYGGFGFAAKPSEFSLSGCSSSSSDDELSQLSSMDAAKTGTEKADCKMSNEELYRQLMLCDYSLSTSPDFECFSPLFEEKGLPVEIRYQLPLALGTANETDKECTICQLPYGIGDHIVTLPCQHFFHACCVDKWLWNHTSCPLCRTEVSLEPNVSQSTSKHRFNECPQLDQEMLRRKMRSSSHSVGFRPVIPAKLEVDQLDTNLTNLAIDEDETETRSLTYLVCPKPQRSHPKQPH